MNYDSIPDFRCDVCGARLGASREKDGPWVPASCYGCEQKRLAKEAPALRKASRDKLDLDVPAFVRQVKALPVFKDCPRPIAQTKVVIVHSAFRRSGRAHGNRMARVRITALTPLSWTLETIVHELVHCALPRGVIHNERFRLTLARAVRELWGLEVNPNPKNINGRVKQYRLDEIIEEHLECELAEGRLKYPRRVAEPPADPSARRAAALATAVEKRAARAVRMLARAEKEAKSAQRRLTKWRTKVSYYERQAAKRGAT